MTFGQGTGEGRTGNGWTGRTGSSWTGEGEVRVGMREQGRTGEGRDMGLVGR